ncbi:MAG: coenzyme F420-0:L-glutamate ligase [Patescibacteria group bacterium]
MGKQLNITVGETTYSRYPIKTHVVKIDEDLIKILEQYASPHLNDGDIIFMSEKIVAISQGRSFPIADIKPSKLAIYLSERVHKSPYGIGLGSPWTMQLALKEAGHIRIFLAIIAHFIGKIVGIKGAFYYVAGRKIAAIDGPCDYTLPPYNKYAKLGPEKPNKVARELKEKIGHEVVIIDANDLGVNILGRSNKKMSKGILAAIFKDNPLGQTNEQTPLCIVRKIIN